MVVFNRLFFEADFTGQPLAARTEIRVRSQVSVRSEQISARSETALDPAFSNQAVSNQALREPPAVDAGSNGDAGSTGIAEVPGGASVCCHGAEVSITETSISGDRIICHCLQVTESTVREAAFTCPLRSLGDIARATGAGTGCNACHRRLRRFLGGS